MASSLILISCKHHRQYPTISSASSTPSSSPCYISVCICTIFHVYLNRMLAAATIQYCWGLQSCSLASSMVINKSNSSHNIQICNYAVLLAAGDHSGMWVASPQSMNGHMLLVFHVWRHFILPPLSVCKDIAISYFQCSHVDKIVKARKNSW